MSPSAAPKEAAVVMDATFEINASGVLEVSVPGVHVRLRPHTDDDRVHVHGFVPDSRKPSGRVQAGDPDRARETFDRRGIATHQSSDRLYVFGNGPPADADGWRWRRAHSSSAHLDLHLPPSLDVEANVPGGAVDVSGLSGDATLEVMGGIVEVEELQGSLDVQGGGESLTVRDYSGPHLNVHWAAGSLHLDQITADSTHLHSSAASVDLQALRGACDLTVNGAPATLRDVEGPCHAVVHGGALTYYGDPEESTSLTAVGGPLHAHLPASHAATLTLTGEQVVLDDAFSFEGERMARRIEGTLNGGGPSLRVRAIRGTAHCSTQNDV